MAFALCVDSRTGLICAALTHPSLGEAPSTILADSVLRSFISSYADDDFKNIINISRFQSFSLSRVWKDYVERLLDWCKASKCDL